MLWATANASYLSSLSPSAGIYQFTADLYVGDGVSNCGVGFGSNNFAGLWYHSGSGWTFDARTITGNSGASTSCGDPGLGKYQNIVGTITIDLIANTVTGSITHSGGTWSTSFGFPEGATDNITELFLYNDYHFGNNGIDIDNIYIWQNFSGAANPSPHDNAGDVSLNPTLSWTPGDDVLSHDVYFGTSESDVNDANTSIQLGVYKGNQPQITYDPCELELETDYYWRIDEVHSTYTHKGQVWSFATISGNAHNPAPPDRAQYVPIDTLLSWSAGARAALYDVYLGTDESDVNNATISTPLGVYQDSISQTTYDPCGLEKDTIYYWRIDAVNVAEEPESPWKGLVWSFSTCLDLASDYYISIDGDDSNPATQAQPLRTMDKAREIILEGSCGSLPAGGVKVWTRGGAYYLAEPMTYPADYNNTDNSIITYKLYSGTEDGDLDYRQITEWTDIEDTNSVTVELPDINSIDWRFYKLFIEDQHQVEASAPHVNPSDPLYGQTVFGPATDTNEPKRIQRRIIVNDDGTVPAPTGGETMADYLNARFEDTNGTQVDTYVVCVGATDEGSLVDNVQNSMTQYFYHGAFGQVDANVDLITQALVNSTHDVGMEIFASIKMNATSDAVGSITYPFKITNPDKLFGDEFTSYPATSVMSAAWSGLDYPTQR